MTDFAPPIGGTTGLSHEHSEAVTVAAQWLADQPEGSVKPIVPALRERFPLSATEACEAAALATKFRIVRRAFS